MQFTKSNDTYKVIRITGVQDNILGVCFSDKKTDIEVVEWDMKNGSKMKSSSEEVLMQVLSGLKDINQILGENYLLSTVYFLPSDSASNSIYKFLIQELVKRLDSNGSFIEV